MEILPHVRDFVSGPPLCGGGRERGRGFPRQSVGGGLRLFTHLHVSFVSRGCTPRSPAFIVTDIQFLSPLRVLPRML